jgi:hypothetical protein
MTPAFESNCCGVSWTCDGSDTLHVAGWSVTAGTWKVWSVLPGMYAEYIGEKSIWMVGFEHDPGLLLTELAGALLEDEQEGNVVHVPRSATAVPIPMKAPRERFERNVFMKTSLPLKSDATP